jgi:thiol-activated cytolysin
MTKELDDKIIALQYKPEEILAYKGDKIDSFKKAEGKNNDGKYIVVTREKVKISDSTSDIGIIDSVVDLTFPGALVLANSHLVENKPDLLSVHRKPIEFRIDLPGLEQDALVSVEDPSYGHVSAKIDEKFNQWNSKYSQTHSIVARSYYNESMVSSESQLLVKFGFGFKQAQKDLSIDFSALN